ncbi:MAG: hypothetical protein V1913_09955 [Fibrobacterota bacterium]
MKARLFEHGLSLLLVTLVMAVAFGIIHSSRNTDRDAKTASLTDYLAIPGTDLSDPFQKSLFRETLNIFYPGREEKNDSLFKAVLRYRQGEFERIVQQTGRDTELSFTRLLEMLGMFLKFLFVYALVMLLTYYGVQTLAVWRFVKQRRVVTLSPAMRAGIALGKGLASLILFSPSYVIAYSIKTSVNTDTMPFMILLGVISNGLLITYANKFYHFLIAESRKGYVETARVKNLAQSYAQDGANGIPLSAILRPFKRFDGHIFNAIFQNARYQYLSALKEQAAFLITGLVIIEMALNIHGYYSYEMLRQMLYRNYDIAILFFLGIFYTVKATEILVDTIHHRETMKYDNRE